MKRRDLNDATYLDRLGTESARSVATTIKQQAQERGIVLPLDDDFVGELLDHAVKTLQGENRIDWPRTSDVRRQVFYEAWIAEMTHQGIRA